MEVSRESAYRLEYYHYDLPEELIAQVPSGQRDASRLLVLDRLRDRVEHRHFGDLPGYLRDGDLLVVNDTRVVPARLRGTKETGGRVELLVLDPYKSSEKGWEEGYTCLLKAAKHTRADSIITLTGGIQVKVLDSLPEGKAMVRFLISEPLLDLLHRNGEVPLPPYIQRNGAPAPVDDAEAYQTVYARNPGAVAAPTAGLHFSRSILEQLERLGVQQTTVTLHVGYGTFAPIRVDDVRNHRMHAEHVEVSAAASQAVEAAKREGRRVVAVGTTVVRTLEWVALQCGAVLPYTGLCDHYIYPGYGFRCVDAMITNFHLPQSTLLLLVSAFAGREGILHAYEEAVLKRYRFFSYGDAMLIL